MGYKQGLSNDHIISICTYLETPILQALKLRPQSAYWTEDVRCTVKQFAEWHLAFAAIHQPATHWRHSALSALTLISIQFYHRSCTSRLP